MKIYYKYHSISIFICILLQFKLPLTVFQQYIMSNIEVHSYKGLSLTLQWVPFLVRLLHGGYRKSCGGSSARRLTHSLKADRFPPVYNINTYSTSLKNKNSLIAKIIFLLTSGFKKYKIFHNRTFYSSWLIQGNFLFFLTNTNTKIACSYIVYTLDCIWAHNENEKIKSTMGKN